MSKENLGWLYYKDMYSKGADENQIKSSLNQIYKASGSDESFNFPQSFKLKTIYPGLIIGSGYAHGLKNDEDSKIGFYFDHTSGLPTIPGSSVKGTLRSLFGFHDKKDDKYREQKQEFIRDLTKKENLDVKLLVDDIFEGKNDKGKAKSIYERDLFFEARVSNLNMKDDYLAPHKDPLKNPIPIKFIKVAGGTSFEFAFKLHDGGGLSANEKLELFFQLLQFSGIGAKTNVGYGQFEEKSLDKFSAEIRIKQEELTRENEETKLHEKEEKDKQELEVALKSADTNVKKIEVMILKLDDSKDIYELLLSYELLDNEKMELIPIIQSKIGDAPENTPKNMKKAKTKWPIKIYEYLKL